MSRVEIWTSIVIDGFIYNELESIVTGNKWVDILCVKRRINNELLDRTELLKTYFDSAFLYDCDNVLMYPKDLTPFIGHDYKSKNERLAYIRQICSHYQIMTKGRQLQKVFVIDVGMPNNYYGRDYRTISFIENDSINTIIEIMDVYKMSLDEAIQDIVSDNDNHIIVNEIVLKEVRQIIKYQHLNS